MTRMIAFFVAPVVLLAAADAASAEISAAKVERIAPDRVAVTWTAPAAVDVYAANRADASTAQARLVSDDDADGRFELTVAPTDRPYFVLKDAKDGTSARVAERVLPLQQGSNFRDIGGYPAAGGKHVRWGRIYRSGATAMLTEQDLTAVKTLGLTEMVDLRSDEERVLAPTRVDGVPYRAVGYSLVALLDPAKPITGDARMHEVYAQMPTLLKPQMKLVFEALLAGKGPVAYNCSAGQDRTGFTSALILSALGVPRDVILADYHLSTTYRQPQYEMPKITPAVAAANPVAGFFAQYQDDPRAQKPQPLFDSQKQPLLGFALAEIDRRWGSVDAYLDQELGVKPADIARLRAEYLE
jgi:protein-tyrosine phosphatase